MTPPHDTIPPTDLRDLAVALAPPATRIRRATEADIPTCAAMVERWLADCLWVPEGITTAHVTARVTGAIRQHTVLVAGDPVEAFLSLDTTTHEVRGLFSTREGQGRATELLDLAKQGRNFLFFNAPTLSAPVQMFFRSQGFVPIGGPAPMAGYPVAGLRMEWWREA